MLFFFCSSDRFATLFWTPLFSFSVNFDFFIHFFLQHFLIFPSPSFLEPNPVSFSSPVFFFIFLSSFLLYPPSPFPLPLCSSGSQRWAATHFQPWRWSRSHASRWTWGCLCPLFPPPFSLPQPTHSPPHGDRLYGNNIHNRHGTGQQQWWRVRPKALLFPVSFCWHQQPHEPNFVPRRVCVSLFKSRLFLFIQRSLAATTGRDHGRLIPDWQPKYPIRGGRGGEVGRLKEL